MLRGSSLIIVLAISLVIGLISSSLILIGYYHRLEGQEASLEKRLDRNLNSGVTLLLSGPEMVPVGEEMSLDLYGAGTDSVELKKIRHGVYELGIARSFSGTFSRAKAFLIGRPAGGKEMISLYLVDQNRPLSVSGNTDITGNAYLPAAGVRKAYVDGKSFRGEMIVHGVIHTSNAALPKLDDNIIQDLKGFFSLPTDTVLAGSETITAIPYDTLSRSFLEKRLLIQSEDTLLLDDISLQGNILLISKAPLTIPASAELNNIIVFAPSVSIAPGFEGRLQVFARDSIRMGKDSHLHYPSVLGLIKARDSQTVESVQPELTLEGGSSVSGIVFTRALDGDDVQKTRITAGKKAEITGQLYADGFLDLQGIVHGSVYCDRFILKTPSTLYENFLVDAVINYRELSSYYLGSPLINTPKQGKVLIWLQ